MTNNSNSNNNNHDTAVIYLPIDSIKEDQQYSTLLPTIDAKSYESLKKNIMENGIKVPLIINTNNILLDGYTRLKIARELGLKKVPCLIKHFDNMLEEKLFIITVNVHRRHLNTTQRLKLALKALKIKEELYKGKEKRLRYLIPFRKNKDKDSNNNNNSSNNKNASFLRGVKNSDEPSPSTTTDTTTIPTSTPTHNNTKLNIWNEIARDFALSYETLSKGKKIEEVAEKDKEIAEMYQKDRPVASIYRRIVEKEARANVRPIVEEGKVKVEDLANVTILHGDFREVLKDIPSNSIDLIFTDPPYSEKYLDLVKDLFLLASRVLKPSGFLAIMYGQNHLDKFFKIFENSNDNGNGNKLRYYWTIAIHMPDGQELFYMKNAVIRWKPIFIFQKEPFTVLEHRFEDHVSRPKPDKSTHEWRQDIESAMYVINSFSKEGSVVLDPMVGTGITIEASLMLKRRCIAVEKDKELYEMLLRRFSNSQ